jgi:hypothetical protein
LKARRASCDRRARLPALHLRHFSASGRAFFRGKPFRALPRPSAGSRQGVLNPRAEPRSRPGTSRRSSPQGRPLLHLRGVTGEDALRRAR